jgi:L-lactate dehydrogenase complex protein LldG
VVLHSHLCYPANIVSDIPLRAIKTGKRKIMASSEDLVAGFTQRAEAVSARVQRVADVSIALDRVMDLCSGTGACRILPDGCTEPLSGAAAGLCDLKSRPVLAAPGIDAEILADLGDRCRAAGTTLVTGQLREHLAGIDIGLTMADYGIAETGPLTLHILILES